MRDYGAIHKRYMREPLPVRFRARWPAAFYFHTNPRSTETWLSTVGWRAW